MTEFRLPSLGADMDEGTLLQWLVAPGDAVHRGQVVAVVDTAKAAIDVECWDEGVVDRLLAEPGSRLPVGAPLMRLRTGDARVGRVAREAAAPAPAFSPAAAAGPLPPAKIPAAAPAAAAAPDRAPARRQVSPAARRLARAQGIDLDVLPERSGAITLADVQAAMPSAPRTGPQPGARAGAMRQVIAAAMARSKREIPHYYLAEDLSFARASDWLAARNAGQPPARRVLAAALMIKAVARALQRYPEFNGFWRDGAFAPADDILVGVAVSLRSGGLVAPALRDAAHQDAEALTRTLLDLVRRTRAGSLRSSELGTATITVTNLGDQGVSRVYGVIHPPQVALVGFGRIGPRPWVAEDGSVQAMPVVTATLSADHRAGDGHRGALLLAEIRDRLQQPESLDGPA